MPKIKHRPPTGEERKKIEARKKGRNDWANDLAGMGLVAMLVALPGILFSKFTGIWDCQEHWFLLIGLIVGIIVMFYMRSLSSDYRKAVVEDATLPVIEADYEITDAIQVHEYDDEGSHYYLKLKDGGVLFLSGQYLYDLEDDEVFPSTSLKTVRTSSSKSLLEIISNGKCFQVKKVLPPFSEDDFREGSLPKDGDVLDIDFDDL